MDPITTALAAGATFVLKGVASEAAKDAYRALRDALVSRLSSLPNLEEVMTERSIPVDYAASRYTVRNSPELLERFSRCK